ncbi:hypothetical protein SUGI_1040950 [Cryptomeria japonica]|uniref:uncharacterized protein LOC131038475 n=1 Tax=Cryptomeria japonica TaxID=3369 RepID=UPI002414722D|nr:uncharacterized protein LOC131038475 [Cryptomeria japonica]GLJ49267.1 hypothetical protein SUGI_1040950 [Cryptomeria japonica]
MECNKDEAERAKEIAEKKFGEKDLMGAQNFALKAHLLYPELDGLAQTMAALEVHIAAENTVNGDMDWYGILDVNQFDDAASLRKQYRRLALLLHPDKNKSVGADGAFRLLHEAWSVLSDRVKRLSYDEKRKRFQQRFWQPQKPASDGNAWSFNNGFYNFNGFTRCTTQTTASTHFPVSPMPWSTPPATFWTACHSCKMQFEYQRMYENKNLWCPNCRKTFCSATFRTACTFCKKHYEYHRVHENKNLWCPNCMKVFCSATFWTACPCCKMQHENHRVYENQNLVCSNCNKTFCAVETTVNNTRESTSSGFQWSSSQEQQDYTNHSAYNIWGC